MATPTTAAEAVADVATTSPAATGRAMLDIFVNTLKEMGESIMATLPYIVVGLILILIGYLLFSLLRKIIVSGLQKVGADGIMESVGVTPLLQKMGIRSPFTVIFGKTIFWLLMLQFIMIVSEQLQLDFVSEPLTKIISFLPNVITAVIIFFVGYIVSTLVRGAIQRSAEGMGLDYARALATLIYGFMLIVIIILAIRQLGVETKILESAVQILLAAFAVALALALGLGLHTLARNIVSGVYARDLYRPGSSIEHEGEQASVAAVGPVTTRLELGDGRFIMVPNHHLVSEIVRGRDE